MEQGGALIPSLFTLCRIAYSIKEDRNDMATWNSRGLRGSTLEDMINKTNEKYNAYIQILKEELIPAMGCTEPIALAYAAAVARKVLGQLPERVDIGASGSIIKNVKSVIVPNTDHLKGIPAAATAGIIAGDPDKELEVIASVTKEQVEEMKEFLKKIREAG